MKLTALGLTEFVDVLASDAPAPGGGSVAALTGAIGVALTSMVGCLTTGKEKYKEHEALTQEVIKEAKALKEQLLDALDRDTEAFNKVGDVFAMPKSTDEEKQKRREAMQEALKGSTVVPFEIMELCLKSLHLTKKACGKSNQNAASDLGVAALNLKAAVQGGWLNVVININGIKDEAFASDYRKRGEAILKEALPLADEIYDYILNSL